VILFARSDAGAELQLHRPVEALVGAPSGGEVQEANEKSGAEISWQVLRFEFKKRAMTAARGAPI
jgi:hypothetical protein